MSRVFGISLAIAFLVAFTRFFCADAVAATANNSAAMHSIMAVESNGCTEQATLCKDVMKLSIYTGNSCFSVNQYVTSTTDRKSKQIHDGALQWMNAAAKCIACHEQRKSAVSENNSNTTYAIGLPARTPLYVYALRHIII